MSEPERAREVPVVVPRAPPLVSGRELDTMVVSNPINAFAFVLESVHTLPGAKWWAVLPLTAFAVRATAGKALLRAHARQHKHYMQPLAGELGAMSHRAMALMRANRGIPANQAKIMVNWAVQRGRLLREKCAGSHLQRFAYAYGWVGLGAVQLMGVRYAVDVDPSFAREGLSWFSSLAEFDPWMRLPLLSVGVSLLALGPAPPAAAGLSLKVRHLAMVGGNLMMLPLLWLFDSPNAVSLYLLGGAAFRLLEEIGTTLWRRQFPPPPPPPAPLRKDYVNPLWERQ